MVKLLFHLSFSSVCCSYCFSFMTSCPILCKSMDCSMQGFSVFHYLLEFAQILILWVGDAIQPSHILLPPSPFAFNLSQHHGLLQWVTCLHQVAKYWSFSFSISPPNKYSGLISFRSHWFDLLILLLLLLLSLLLFSD